MQTIRARLAVGYAIALGATLFVFAGIIYIAQGSQAFAELDSRVRVESDLIAAILGESFRARERVVVADPLGRPVLTPDVASLLEGVPGYVIVVGPERALLHLSAEARSLPFGSARALIDVAEDSVAGGFGLVDLAAPVGQVRYFVRPISEAGPNVAAVVSAAPTSGFVVSPPRLLTAMLWTVPFILVMSLVIGYLLVGRTLKPVDLIVDEVEAISDGRSLHRRLAEPTSYDELARLTVTLNAMLSRLEKSFGTLRRFTADASHELKTPLASISGFGETLERYELTGDEQRRVASLIRGEAGRLQEMVTVFLDLERLGAGHWEGDAEIVDFSELVRGRLEILAAAADARGQSFAPSLADGCRVRGVPALLDRVVDNLLGNAIKYSVDGDSIDVVVRADDGRIVFEVSDHGPGIPADEIPRLTERFYRIAGAAESGSGLGLALVDEITTWHGGCIIIESETGAGSTFTVELPAAGED